MWHSEWNTTISVCLQRSFTSFHFLLNTLSITSFTNTAFQYSQQMLADSDRTTSKWKLEQKQLVQILLGLRQTTRLVAAVLQIVTKQKTKKSLIMGAFDLFVLKYYMTGSQIFEILYYTFFFLFLQIFPSPGKKSCCTFSFWPFTLHHSVTHNGHWCLKGSCL